MAHLIVEYSANIEQEMKLPALLRTLHGAALETGVFPPGGLRTRAARRKHYVIADEDPQNCFVHLMVRLGHGRALEVRQKAAQHLFDVLTRHLEAVFQTRPMAITLEVVTIDPDLSYKKNNLHDKLKRN